MSKETVSFPIHVSHDSDTESFQSINIEEPTLITPKRPGIPPFIRTSYRRPRSLTLSERGTPVNEQDIQRFLSIEALHHSIHAPFDLVGFIPRGPCAPDTRNQLLVDLMQWCDPVNTPSRIAWLHGKAGTGKTTLAYSLCQKLSEMGALAASFFCSRLLPDTSDIELVFPTIAYQLARLHEGFHEALEKILKSNTDDSQLSLEGQLQQFILKPFQAASGQMPSNLVVVIDALEQCTKGQSRFIEAVLYHSPLPFKILIASRPDPPIRRAILSRSRESVARFDLHEVDPVLVQRDITTFLRSKLSHLPRIRVEQAIPTLAVESGHLFIYAATIARRLDRDNANDSLRVIRHPPRSALEPVCSLYEDVLAQSFPVDLSTDQVTQRKHILHTVICAREPLTKSELASFWDISLLDVACHLDALRSVISVPDKESGTVAIFHSSFLDFIAEPRSSFTYCLSLESFHLTLALRCFEIMNRSLKRDICELKDRCPNSSVPSEVISRHIPHGLAYASLYAMEHWVLSGARITNPPQSELQTFVDQHLLHWLECLSVLRLLPAAAGALRTLSVMGWDESMAQIVTDTLRVLDLNYEAIEYSCLEVYHSALVWVPSGAVIRLRRPSLWRQRGLPTVISGLPPKWEGAEQYLNNNQSGVNCIAISSNATRLVSGSDDSNVRIWNVMSHRNDHILTGHSTVVLSVALSRDGRFVASSSPDTTIRVWGMESHEVLGILRGHTDWVNSVVFSYDGTRLCSGSSDTTIRVWDLTAALENQRVPQGHSQIQEIRTSQTIQRDVVMKGHIGGVRSVAFSPDSSFVMSGSDDHTVRFWRSTDSTSTSTLRGYRDGVTSVAWSPTGHLVATASGSLDKLIRLYTYSYMGALPLRELEGHTQTITSIAFSPDGAQLASGSTDQTLRIWNTKTGQALSILYGHADAIRCVAFFPDGQHIISASSDCSIRIWGTPTVTEQPQVPSPSIVDNSKQVRKVKSLGGLITASLGLSQNQNGSSTRHSEGLYSIKYLTFSPSGAKLAVASSGTLCVLDAASGAEECRIQGRYPITAIAFSPTGRQVAAGSSDFSVRIWSADNGRKWCTLRNGHTSWILALAFSPDGRQIASASADRTIRIWPIFKSFREERVSKCLVGHIDQVQTLSFSEDGKRLATGSADNSIRVWDISSGQAQTALPLNQTDPYIDSSRLNVQSVTFMPGVTGNDLFSLAISTAEQVMIWKHNNEGEHFHVHRGFKNVTFCVGGPSSFAGFDDGWLYEWTGHDRSITPRRILWIPHQYRHQSDKCAAFSSTAGRRVCLGSEGGRMLLIHLR